MSFTAQISGLNTIADAISTGYCFTIDVGYSGGDGVTDNSIQLLRYISEKFPSENYIPINGEIPGASFSVIDDRTVIASSGTFQFKDDLSQLQPEIRSQIFETNERYLAYTLYGQAFHGFGVCPYVFTSSVENGVAAYSPRTQVLHNILHLENEPIWFSNISSGTTPDGNNFSRVAVDMVRLYLDESHQGVEGIGGWVWAANRNGATKNVFRFRGRDGLLCKVYDSSLGARGISINQDTGEAFSGGTSKYIYRLTIDPTDYTKGTSSVICTRDIESGQMGCYGLTPVFNQPGIFYESNRSNGNTNSLVVKYDFRDIQNPSPPSVISSGKTRTYGIVSDPVGNVFVSYDGGTIKIIAGPDSPKTFSAATRTGLGCCHRGICAEFRNTYPNGLNSNHVFLANSVERKVMRWKMDQFGFVAGSVVAYAINLSGIFEPCGVGADSENNQYIVGTDATRTNGNKILKIYRVENNDTYPLGATCRYPSDTLDDFIANKTNTNITEIEWFLLRDPDSSTFDPPAAAAYNALLVDIMNTVTESRDGISYTRTVYGKTVSGNNLWDKINNVNQWYADYGSDINNRTGRFVWPNYATALQDYSTGDKYLFFTGVGSKYGSYMYSDFTGSVLLQTLPLFLDGVSFTDIDPEKTLSSSSVSSVSSSSRSSMSSSSEILNIYDLKYATYASDCMSVSSVNNPLIGNEIGMETRGSFGRVPSQNEIAFAGDNIHISKGGLEKTVANGGSIFCKDASKLFSMSSGAVSIRICLPEYDISHGIYMGLGKSRNAFEDFVIFGVNIGEHYISQPGIYAAFTKKGIEFTIWTSAGREQIVASNGINVKAGEEIAFDFVWDNSGLLMDNESNMLLSVNGIRFSKKANIASSSSPAEFWLLDTPYGKSDLNVIIKRIEIYSNVPRRNRHIGDLSSSRTSESTVSAKYLNSGEARLDFSIISSQGPSVIIDPPKFHRIVIDDVDMRSVGPIGSSMHKIGEDLGREYSPKTMPEPLLDLPPGFITQREANE